MVIPIRLMVSNALLLILDRSLAPSARKKGDDNLPRAVVPVASFLVPRDRAIMLLER